MAATFLEFSWAGFSDSGKTSKWQVSSEGAVLGGVRWYAPWRRYVFYPVSGTLFDAACLSEIQRFIVGQMNARRGIKTYSVTNVVIHPPERPA